jgi:hypothetical protein
MSEASDTDAFSLELTMDKTNLERRCECQMIKILSELRESPIRFNLQTKTFNLEMIGGCFPLRYCFFCGGQLPQEDYSQRPQPDPEEEREVITIMESVSTWKEMFATLGEPDETHSFESFGNNSSVGNALATLHERFPEFYDKCPDEPWVRFARYTSRWPSLNLDIYCYANGSLKHQIWGQSPNQYKPPKSVKWWRRT